mgnify:CR=1 FL=1
MVNPKKYALSQSFCPETESFLESDAEKVAGKKKRHYLTFSGHAVTAKHHGALGYTIKMLYRVALTEQCFMGVERQGLTLLNQVQQDRWCHEERVQCRRRYGRAHEKVPMNMLRHREHKTGRNEDD